MTDFVQLACSVCGEPSGVSINRARVGEMETHTANGRVLLNALRTCASCGEQFPGDVTELFA